MGSLRGHGVKGVEPRRFVHEAAQVIAVTSKVVAKKEHLSYIRSMKDETDNLNVGEAIEHVHS